MRPLRDALVAAIRWLLVAMLLAMTVVLFLQIICRYFFQVPLVWSEEMALVLMLWITFLGSALLQASNEHIGIDFLVRLLPHVTRRALEIVAGLLMFAFNCALAYGAWLVVQAVAGSITPGMKISMAWHYGSTLVGGLLLILVSIEQLVAAVRGKAAATG